jgi:hypothetical protein
VLDLYRDHPLFYQCLLLRDLGGTVAVEGGGGMVGGEGGEGRLEIDE